LKVLDMKGIHILIWFVSELVELAMWYIIGCW
jgi:hypothetical protein